ncbi:MAG: Type secretion system protein subtype b [Pseudomonadota bacterium]|jgi:hypothetical protein
MNHARPASEAAAPTTWWRRLALLWRLHFGMPAAVGLAVLLICLPLLLRALEELREVRAEPQATPLRRAGVSGSPVTPPGIGTAAAGSASAAMATASGASASSPPGAAVAAASASVSVAQNLEALMLEVLPSGQRRGADLGELMRLARQAELTILQSDYGMEAARQPGLVRLRVDLVMRGSDGQLQQFLTRAQEQFPNLAVDGIQWQAQRQGRPTISLQLLQFYRAVPGT